MTSKANVYSMDSIQVLTLVEAVRKRPGMYIGDARNGSGLHNMLREVVSEALARQARRIRVSVEGRLAEVEDDGDGIPVSRVERLLTKLDCGPGGPGPGLPVVNALCESLDIEVRSDGWSWHQPFARGVAVMPIERGARTERSGTRVRLRADAAIFGATPFDRARVREHLRDAADVHPAVAFELMAERIVAR